MPTGPFVTGGAPLETMFLLRICEAAEVAEVTGALGGGTGLFGVAPLLNPIEDAACPNGGGIGGGAPWV